MTREDMILELTERFESELEELPTTQLSKLLSASEGVSLLSDEFLNEDVELIIEDEDDDEEDDDIKELTLMDDLWDDDKDE